MADKAKLASLLRQAADELEKRDGPVGLIRQLRELASAYSNVLDDPDFLNEPDILKVGSKL